VLFKTVVAGRFFLSPATGRRDPRKRIVDLRTKAVIRASADPGARSPLGQLAPATAKADAFRGLARAGIRV
jgi:hypothetical protein